GILSGTLTYDDASRTTTYTDSLGHTSSHRYNTEGLVVEETDALGHTTRTQWDERGDKPLAVTDPLGRTVRYTYDDQGNLSRVALPDGAEATARYNALGQAVEVTEPGGATWHHTYDDQGNLLSTTDPLGARTSYTYSNAGHLASVTDAVGAVRAVKTNPAGIPVAVTDELGHTTAVRRDSFGRITDVTDPLGRTVRTTWTTEGKPSRREHPDGTVESWTWDAEGNPLTHTDQNGHTTHHTAGHFDVPATRTDPDGAVYTFTYNTELLLTQVTNPHALTWTYTYDEAGRLTSETDFNGRTLTYTRNAAGELTSRTNGAGETLHYTRDALGRITEQRDSDGEVVTFGYDEAGDLVRAANAATEVTYARDALGRVLSESADGRTTTYAYDTLGRRTRRTTPSGLTSHWSYDAAGRPGELRSDAGTLTFAHDAAGQETHRRIGDAVTLTQTWDPTGRLATQSLAGRADDPARLLQHHAYAYRPDGYLTEIRELVSGTRRFDLDPVGRVTGVRAHGWRETYAYDAAGRLTHATAPSHPAPGEREFDGTLVKRAGRTTYEHDAQGRLVRKTRRLLNGQTRTWTYSWNAEDRLVSAGTPDGDTWHYTYDPLGRRVAKDRLLGDGSSAGRTAFAWDGNRLAEQELPDGRVTTWDYAPDSHQPLTQTDHRPLLRKPGGSLLAELAADPAADRTTAFHGIVTDPVGTPTELVDAQGKVAWSLRPGLWGTAVATGLEPPTVECPLRFPGQYADPETGLHYNHFRYYDPETARYLSPDPLGLEPAPDHHAYVPNATGWIDPLGLAPKGPKDPLDLGSGYRGRLDTWQEGTKGTDFEIHVYDKSGREVGIFGSDGWFNKHGTTAADVQVPPSVENALKGRAVDTLRRTGRVGPKGTEDISGDKWQRPRLAAEGCK
ncbi:RHS repeat-associated core domain-containing protein, partial [Streptomyces sp. NPDC058301]|uniref:RHS repeat-associated core domain-containing protein n=1 Tax=Streptomyces sp. NPDC058301 TaxID=3346436 RepID=UPI0036E54313